MKNKKHILAVIALTASALTLVGCDTEIASNKGRSIPEPSETTTDEAHTHSRASSYSYDENGHYYKCSGCDENIRFDYSDHVYSENNSIVSCFICGYTPYAERDNLYSIIKTGITNFYNDTESSTFNSVISKTYETGNYSSASLETVNGTFDRNNATFYAIGTTENTYNDTSYSNNYSIYIDNDDGNYHEYMDNYGRSKPIYNADKNTSQNQYDNYLDTALDLDLLSRLNLLDSYDEVKEYMDLYLSEDLIGFSSSYTFTTDNDSVTFNICTSATNYLKTLLEKVIYTASITVTNERMTDFTYTYQFDSVAPDGTTYFETRETTTHLSEGFDNDFYNSFTITDDYTETGLGTTYKLTLYLDDYLLVTYYQRINEELSYTIYDNYGTYYYDKDYTKPYNGEDLTSDITVLYIKPNESIPEDKALVWYVADYDYISSFKDAFSYNDKKIMTFPTYYDAGYSYPLPITYESIDPHVLVNDVETNDYTLKLEGGKNYIIVSKAKYFII